EPFATVTLALVLAVSGPPEECVAVTVGVPAVLKTKFDNVPVPEARVRFPAVPALSSEIVAAASLLVMVTLGAELAMIFQLASTALTMIPLVIALPAVCAFGVPFLPLPVPGAAVSPGIKICSLVTAPAFTVSTWFAEVTPELAAVMVGAPARVSLYRKLVA